MLRYVAQRLLLMIPTLLGVAILVFLMLRVMAGDPVEVMLRGDGANVAAGGDRGGAHAPGTRPADLRPVRQVAGRHGDRRLRRVDVDRQAGVPGNRLQAAAFAAGRRHGDDPRGPARRFRWERCRRSTRTPGSTTSIRVFSIAGLAVPSFWLGMIIILLLLSLFHWHPPLTFTPVLRESAREPVAAHLAGAGRGLPLFRGGHAHDALHAARGAAGGLHPHRARQGRVRAAGRGAARARATRCCRWSR